MNINLKYCGIMINIIKLFFKIKDIKYTKINLMQI